MAAAAAPATTSTAAPPQPPAATADYLDPDALSAMLAEVTGKDGSDDPLIQAALEQIRAFLTGAWAGQARVILPTNCAMNTPAGSCDFSASR